jgi:hypothetical protein
MLPRVTCMDVPRVAHTDVPRVPVRTDTCPVRTVRTGTVSPTLYGVGGVCVKLRGGEMRVWRGLGGCWAD